MGVGCWLALLGACGVTGGYSIPTFRTLSSIHCQGGTVRGRAASVSTLKASWGTRGCAHGATNGALGGRKTALRKNPAVGDSTDVRRRATTTALHAATTASMAAISVPNVATTAGVACIERQSVHVVNELVEGCMCSILDS